MAPSISPSVATPPSPGPAPEGRIQVGVVFLSTFLGRATIGTSREGPTEDQTPDLDAAHGVGLSLGYNVIAGLSLGVAPQVFWNLNTNNLVYSTNYYKSDSELDLLARIAYAHEVSPRLAVYAELLPGYSILSYQFSVTNRGSQVFWSDRAKGLVIGLGGGAAYDITRIFFVNLGVGYQLGYQRVVSPTDSAATYHANTQFLRVAAGVGVKL